MYTGTVSTKRIECRGILTCTKFHGHVQGQLDHKITLLLVQKIQRTPSGIRIQLIKQPTNHEINYPRSISIGLVYLPTCYLDINTMKINHPRICKYTFVPWMECQEYRSWFVVRNSEGINNSTSDLTLFAVEYPERPCRPNNEWSLE